MVATLSLSSDKTGSRETGSALITSLLHSTEQQTDVNKCFWSKMMKYLLTVQLEKDILHLSISLGNKPMTLRFSQNMLYPQCWVSPFGHFCMACKHFELVLECESTSCPSARTQGPGAPPPPLCSQGLHSLQLECVCCWLCLLSDCVGDSGRVPGLVVQAGGSFPPHMWLQLREGKGLVPEGHCYCPHSQRSHRADATQIGLIFSAWRREGNNEEFFQQLHYYVSCSSGE